MVMRERPVQLAPRLSEAELAAHREFVAGLGENVVWQNYPSGEA
jgi:DNA polymerase-3 subunit epsilon